jgi:hypothetical protein
MYFYYYEVGRYVSKWDKFQFIHFMTKKWLSKETRCVVNATNAPALSQSFKAMFNLFQFQER